MIKIQFLQNFLKQAKKINKNNKKLIFDLEKLEKDLVLNPKKWISLWDNMYKIRIQNSSKNIWKRWWFRIITYFLDENEILYLVSIYEKNTTSNVLTKNLSEIIKNELN